MPSPFPGMDPRLECTAFWRDFQLGLLCAIHAELNSTLPDTYAACLDRHVWGWMSDSESQRADAATLVIKKGSVVKSLPAPFTTTLSFIMSGSEPFVRVQHLQSGRDVSVIEVLGPERKKAGQPRNHYLWKRNDLFGSRTNLIEIDFLREGERMPIGDSAIVSSDYLIMVSDKVSFPELGLWSISIRDTVPPIPVPLDYFEEAITLNVKKCIDRAFDEGPFMRLGIDRRPIHPPLTEPDAAWARELLSNRTIPT